MRRCIHGVEEAYPCEDCEGEDKRAAARQRALMDLAKAVRRWAMTGRHDEIAYAEHLAAFLAAGGKLEDET